MLRLAVTIAYELVHCFTGYLLKKSTLHTPANVSYGYGGDSSSGESGRKWEQRMFGGYIDARERGGEVLLGAKQQLVQKVYVAKAAVVEAILKRGKTFLNSRNTHSIVHGIIKWSIAYWQVYAQAAGEGPALESSQGYLHHDLPSQQTSKIYP